MILTFPLIKSLYAYTHIYIYRSPSPPSSFTHTPRRRKMENEQSSKSEKEERSASMLQLDTIFFKKILARNSNDSSSSISDHHSVCEVPFDWESMPGTPRNPYRDIDAILPPIKPPPAVESVDMPKPAIILAPKSSKNVCFWNRQKNFYPCKSKTKITKKLPPRCPNIEHDDDHQRSSSVSITSSSPASTNSLSSYPPSGSTTSSSSSSSHSSFAISRKFKSCSKSRSSKFKALARLFIKWVDFH